MLSNKEAGMVEPSQETLDNIARIKNMETLAKKIEQIGFETQLLFDFEYRGNLMIKSKKELDQVFGDIWYYMNYLRSLTRECPKPLESGINLDNDKKLSEAVGTPWTMICFVTKEHEKQIKEKLPQEIIYFAENIPEFNAHLLTDTFPVISHELVTENTVNELNKILDEHPKMMFSILQQVKRNVPDYDYDFLMHENIGDSVLGFDDFINNFIMWKKSLSCQQSGNTPNTDDSGIFLTEIATRWYPTLDNGKWPMWIKIGTGIHEGQKDEHSFPHAHFKAISGETGVFSTENEHPPNDYSEVNVVEGEIPTEYKKFIADWAKEKSKSYPKYTNWYVARDDWCVSCFCALTDGTQKNEE